MHRHLSKLPFAAAVMVAFVAPTTAVQASTLTTVKYQSSVPVQTTEFDKFVTLPKFNPNLGILQSVFVKLDAEVQGAIQIENRSAKSATATADFAAEVSLLRPDAGNQVLLTTLPKQQIAKQFTAYDLTTDFAGTSGATFANLSSSESDSKTLTSDFDFFIGSGNIDLPVIARDFSKTTATGNFAAIFETNAGANVEVIYNYIKKEPPKRKVPESQVPLGAFAAVGVCLLLKSKYRQLI